MEEHDKAGRITVHLADMRDQLVEDERNFSTSQFLERQGRATSDSLEREPEMLATTDVSRSATLTEWLKEKSIRNIPHDVTPDPGPVATVYETLLDDEETFIKEVDYYLQEKDQLDKRKKDMLYRKWKERVFDPIQSQIVQKMEGPAYKWLDHEKRELFERYLNYRNTKGYIFLDTLQLEDYDSLSLTRPVSPLHVTRPRLNDPLISQQRDRDEEDQIVEACEYGLPVTTSQLKAVKRPLVPLGRHGTECSTWLAMEITSIDSQVRLRSRQRMRHQSNKSRIDFEKWFSGSTDKRLADQELQLQHKRTVDVKHDPLDLSMIS